MRRMLRMVFSLFFCFLFIIACSKISKKDAEGIARGFIRTRVKFFAKGEGGSMDLGSYNISKIKSYEENRHWVVILHIESKVGNETKDNDLVVKIDKNGKVFEFNGMKVR